MNSYDPKYIEPRPWILGGSNGRGLTTASGYVGDGLIADFDTKVHAELALKCINAHDDLAAALRVGIEMARDTDASDPDEVGRAFDNFLNVARAALAKAAP